MCCCVTKGKEMEVFCGGFTATKTHFSPFNSTSGGTVGYPVPICETQYHLRSHRNPDNLPYPDLVGVRNVVVGRQIEIIQVIP